MDIQILDDNDLEKNLSFTVHLIVADSRIMIENDNAITVITIFDDDCKFVSVLANTSEKL